MTVIAAAIDKTGGYLAADSASHWDGMLYQCSGKLRLAAPWLVVGFSGAALVDSLYDQGLFDAIARDTIHRESEVARSTLGIARWWQRIHADVSAMGHHETSNGSHLIPANGIAVTAGGICLLNADGCVTQVHEPSWAIGCGAHLAIGAMHAARRRHALARVEAGVAAACRYSDSCRAPVDVVRVLREAL